MDNNIREIWLDSILNSGSVIYKANPNLVWLGEANVVTSSVYASESKWNGPLYILDHEVPAMGSVLMHRENWRPVNLASSNGLVFQGAITLGDDFGVYDETFAKLQGNGYESCQVVFDCLIGKEVNQLPRNQPGRKVINFLIGVKKKFTNSKVYLNKLWKIFNQKEETTRIKAQGRRDGDSLGQGLSYFIYLGAGRDSRKGVSSK